MIDPLSEQACTRELAPGSHVKAGMLYQATIKSVGKVIVNFCGSKIMRHGDLGRQGHHGSRYVIRKLYHSAWLICFHKGN